ncbi:MAG: hypothetical protein LBR69_01310 [Endomicrobium sp.]|nr:hypothetical protein [Endomicrobium sp.]
MLNKIKEQVIKDINFLYKNAKIENKAARSKINDFARREIINIRNSAAAEIEKKVNEITNREAEFLDEGYFTAKDLKHLKYPQELEGLMFDKVSFNAIDKFFERLKPSSIEDAVKGIKLFQATFDLFQMAEVARQRFGVTGFRGLVGYDWITNDKDFYDTAIKATERGLVLGKNEDIATDIIKRMGKPIVENETSWFGKNVINKLNDLSDKNKTTKAVKDMVMRLEDLQWKTVVPNTKLSMWRELSKKYKEIYAQYSVEEAETIAAETVNDFFQGINWDRLMAKDSTIGKFLNRNRIRMLRYAFFGPDRLAAVASRISKTFDGPNKAEYAKAHFRSIIMLLLLQNVLQYALSGHLSDENTKGSELDLEIPFIQDRKGNPIAVNIGGTAFEPLRFINKPYRFVMNKQGILPRVLGVGQKDYQRPKNVLEEIWQVATIPFAVQNIAEYALQDSDNPKTGDTDLPEAIVRAGAEFIGIPTTFRTGRNKEATIADLIKGDATLYQYVMSKDLKKTKKKL